MVFGFKNMLNSCVLRGHAYLSKDLMLVIFITFSNSLLCNDIVGTRDFCILC